MIGTDEHLLAGGQLGFHPDVAFQNGEEHMACAGEDGVGVPFDAELAEGGITGEMLWLTQKRQEIGGHGGDGSGFDVVDGLVRGLVGLVVEQGAGEAIHEIEMEQSCRHVPRAGLAAKPGGEEPRRCAKGLPQHTADGSDEQVRMLPKTFRERGPHHGHECGGQVVILGRGEGEGCGEDGGDLGGTGGGVVEPMAQGLELGAFLDEQDAAEGGEVVILKKLARHVGGRGQGGGGGG